MNLVIFGNGPLPCEGKFPVTAPGGRTWQIVRTVANALAKGMPQVITLRIVTLDDTPRTVTAPTEIVLPCSNGRSLSALYLPLPYDKFITPDEACAASGMPLPAEIAAVIGCASVQPYSTAAAFAAKRKSPLWIDVFGDAMSEIQTQAQQAQADPATETALPGTADVQQVHVWKLLLDGLLAGDRFSTLSDRQRFALIGQLGCAGRLNYKTADDPLVASIPYGIVPGDFPIRSNEPKDRLNRPTVTLMWNGSFNTWMDVDTLVDGLTAAMQTEPRLRLMVVGGKVPGYSEGAYTEFLNRIQASGLQGSVQLLDWQPYEALSELYQKADIGISIDRPSFEAETGSRTRIVHFLASGVPVISTNLTELTDELANKKLIATFECGNANQLAEQILNMVSHAVESREMGEKGRDFVLDRFSSYEVGGSLAKWVLAPEFASDKKRSGPEDGKPDTNELIAKWRKVRASLGA